MRRRCTRTAASGNRCDRTLPCPIHARQEHPRAASRYDMTEPDRPETKPAPVRRLPLRDPWETGPTDAELRQSQSKGAAIARLKRERQSLYDANRQYTPDGAKRLDAIRAQLDALFRS